MEVPLAQFADYMINGLPFAEKKYHSVDASETDFSSEQILVIQNVWADLETYSLIACIGSAVLTFAATAIVFALGHPVIGMAILAGGIALSIFSLSRYVDATYEKGAWTNVKPGQNSIARLQCMKEGMTQRYNEIRPSFDNLERTLESFVSNLVK